METYAFSCKRFGNLHPGKSLYAFCTMQNAAHIPLNGMTHTHAHTYQYDIFGKFQAMYRIYNEKPMGKLSTLRHACARLFNFIMVKLQESIKL